MRKLLYRRFRHDSASGSLPQFVLGENRRSHPSVRIPAGISSDKGGANVDESGFRSAPVQLVQILKIVFPG